MVLMGRIARLPTGKKPYPYRLVTDGHIYHWQSAYCFLYITSMLPIAWKYAAYSLEVCCLAPGYSLLSARHCLWWAIRKGKLYFLKKKISCCS